VQARHDTLSRGALRNYFAVCETVAVAVVECRAGGGMAQDLAARTAPSAAPCTTHACGVHLRRWRQSHSAVGDDAIATLLLRQIQAAIDAFHERHEPLSVVRHA
jgi:hypothetical protein